MNISLNHSESFPTDIRTASVGIVHTLETVALMVNVKCYPLLTASLGFSSVAFIYREMLMISCQYFREWSYIVPTN